jgi:hypothetical protein
LTPEQRERINARRRASHAQLRAEQASAGREDGEWFAPLGRWVADAECVRRRIDPDWFTPPRERNPLPAPDVLLREQRYVAQACHACPVRTECLSEARANGHTGVWGGVLRSVRREHDLIATHVTPNLSERKAA